MNARALAMTAMLATASCLQGQFERVPKEIPTNAAVVLQFDQSDFVAGENIFANYVISNRGGATFRIETGGDYRGGTRAGRLKVTARRDDGYVALDPEPAQWNMGGFVGPRSVAFGSNQFVHVSAARYCEFVEPGEYTITAFHDLGWGERQTNDIREATARIRVRVPTAMEAHEFVVNTLGAPKHNGWTWGEKGRQLPDITVLRHPIFLPALIEAAAGGSFEALKGIESVRTVEGTEALVRFLKVPGMETWAAARDPKKLLPPGTELPKTAAQAAQYLETRLPKSLRLDSDWPPGHNAHLQRLQATWHPRFAEPVRQFARYVLRTSDREALLLAASELGSVGRAEDFDLLKLAVERAATLTDTKWHSDHGYPYHQSVARSLAITAFQLGAANHDFSKPKNAGEALLFLRQLSSTNSARPEDWERTCLRLLRDPSAFIRAETVWLIPKPAPDRIQEEFLKLMTDSDAAVQNWAFEALQDTRSPAVRRNALAILSATSNRWLFNSAVSIAISNDARVEAAEIIAKRFNDSFNEPGAGMPHEATRALFEIASGGGHVSGGFNGKVEAGALQKRWLDFIAKHRTELAQGRNFKPGDGSGLDDLLSPGWQFYQPKE